MRKFLKYLRIVFSITCLIACVLLIALWVRSYWRWDVLYVNPIGTQVSQVNLSLGVFDIVHQSDANSPLGPPRWEWIVYPITPSEMFRPSNLFRFQFSRNQTDGWLAEFPLWFPLILFIALGLAPWLRLRFSIRTLSIATAMLSVFLWEISVVAMFPDGHVLDCLSWKHVDKDIIAGFVVVCCVALVVWFKLNSKKK